MKIKILVNRTVGRCFHWNYKKIKTKISLSLSIFHHFSHFYLLQKKNNIDSDDIYSVCFAEFFLLNVLNELLKKKFLQFIGKCGKNGKKKIFILTRRFHKRTLILYNQIIILYTYEARTDVCWICIIDTLLSRPTCRRLTLHSISFSFIFFLF